MEVEPDEPGGDTGVVGEGRRDGLPDDGLGVGAGGAVKPHLQLPLRAARRQEQRGGDQRRHARHAAPARHDRTSWLVSL